MLARLCPVGVIFCQEEIEKTVIVQCGEVFHFVELLTLISHPARSSIKTPNRRHDQIKENRMVSFT